MNKKSTTSNDDRQLRNVDQGDLERISGGVAPVFDSKGNIVSTCVGPRLPIKGTKKPTLMH